MADWTSLKKQWTTLANLTSKYCYQKTGESNIWLSDTNDFWHLEIQYAINSDNNLGIRWRCKRDATKNDPNVGITLGSLYLDMIVNVDGTDYNNMTIFAGGSGSIYFTGTRDWTEYTPGAAVGMAGESPATFKSIKSITLKGGNTYQGDVTGDGIITDADRPYNTRSDVEGSAYHLGLVLGGNGLQNVYHGIPADFGGADGSVVGTYAINYSTGYTLSYDANGGVGTLPSNVNNITSTTVGTNGLTWSNGTSTIENVGRNFSIKFFNGTTQVGNTITTTGGKATKTTTTTYTSNGWNTAANGSGTSYTNNASITLSSNTTLYAQKKSSGSSDSYTQTTNGSFTAPAAPTKQFYTFKFWGATSNATTGLAAGSTSSASSDTNYYAVWDHVSFSNNYISINVSSDKKSITVTNNYDSAITITDVNGASKSILVAAGGTSSAINLNSLSRGTNTYTVKVKNGSTEISKTFEINIPAIKAPIITCTSNAYRGDTINDIKVKNNSSIANIITYNIKLNASTKVSEDTFGSVASGAISSAAEYTATEDGTYTITAQASDAYSDVVVEAQKYNTSSTSFTISLPSAGTISVPEYVYTSDAAKTFNIIRTNSNATNNVTYELSYSYTGVQNENLSMPSTSYSFNFADEKYYGKVLTFKLITKYRSYQIGQASTASIKIITPPNFTVYKVSTLSVGEYTISDLFTLSGKNVLKITDADGNELIESSYEVSNKKLKFNNLNYINNELNIIFAAGEPVTINDHVLAKVINTNEFSVKAYLKKDSVLSDTKVLNTGEFLENLYTVTDADENNGYGIVTEYYSIDDSNIKQVEQRFSVNALCDAPVIKLAIQYDTDAGTITKWLDQGNNTLILGQRAIFSIVNPNTDNSNFGKQYITYSFKDQATYNEGPFTATLQSGEQIQQSDIDYEFIAQNNLKENNIAKQFTVFNNESILYNSMTGSLSEISFDIWYSAENDTRSTKKKYKYTYKFNLTWPKFIVKNKNTDYVTIVTGGNTDFTIETSDWYTLTDKSIKYYFTAAYKTPNNGFKSDFSPSQSQSKNTQLACYYINDTDFSGKNGSVDVSFILPQGSSGNAITWEDTFEAYFYDNENKAISEYAYGDLWKFTFTRELDSSINTSSETYGVFKLDSDKYGFKFPENFLKYNVTVDTDLRVLFDITEAGEHGVKPLRGSVYKDSYVKFWPSNEDGGVYTLINDDSDATTKKDYDTETDGQHITRKLVSEKNLPVGTYKFILTMINTRGISSNYVGEFLITPAGLIEYFDLQRVEKDESGEWVASEYGTTVKITIQAKLRSYKSEPVKLQLYHHVLDASYDTSESRFTDIYYGSSDPEKTIEINEVIYAYPFPSYNSQYKGELRIADNSGKPLTSTTLSSSTFYRTDTEIEAKVKEILPITNGWKEICISDNYKDEYVLGYYYSQNFFYDRTFSEITGEVTFENPIEDKKRSQSYMYLDLHTNYVYSYNGISFVPYSTKITEFQKEIIAKNILKGVTPYIDKEDDFNYSVLHTPIVSDQKALHEVSNISTNAIKLNIDTREKGVSDNANDGSSAISSINVLSNETVQLYRPGLTEDTTYHLCVYEAYLNPESHLKVDEDGNPVYVLDSNGESTNEQDTEYTEGKISANTTYTLKSGNAEGTGEFIIFYAKQDSDTEYYTAHYYGPGSIIKVNNKTLVSTTTDPNNVSRAASYIRSKAASFKNSNYFESFITAYEYTNAISKLSSSIGSTWSVSSMKLNQEILNDTMNYCYWITNDIVESDYSSNSNQYKLIMNPTSNEYRYEHVLKDGEYFIYTDQTKQSLKIVSTGTKIIIDLINQDAKVDKLLVYEQSISNIIKYGTLALTDNWYEFNINSYQITVQQQDFINIAEGGNVSFEAQTDDAKGLFFIDRDGLHAVSTDSDYYKDTSIIIDSNSNINSINDLINSSYIKDNLYGFIIQYKNANDSKQVIRNDDEQTAWNIRTFLSYNIAKNKTQELQTDDNTVYKLGFGSLSGESQSIDINKEFFDGDQIYIQSDSDFYCTGGQDMPINQQLINGAYKNPSLYAYKKSTLEYNDVENNRYSVNNIGDALNIEVIDDINNLELCNTQMLHGNYILPVANYNGENKYSYSDGKYNDTVKDLYIAFKPITGDSTSAKNLKDFLDYNQNMNLRKKYFMVWDQTAGSEFYASKGKLILTVHRNDWVIGDDNRQGITYQLTSPLETVSNDKPHWYLKDNKYVIDIDLSQHGIDANSPIHITGDITKELDDDDFQPFDTSIFSWVLSADKVLTITANTNDTAKLEYYARIYFLPEGFKPITIQLLNLSKYSYTDIANDYDIQSTLQKYDFNNQFNYLINIDYNDQIDNPLQAAQFNNYNHAYNEFTICQSKIPQVTVQQ